MTPEEQTAEDAERERELAADLERLRAEYPNRRLDVITFADREMIVFAPTSGQVAAMLRLSQSHTMDNVQRVANFLDILEGLLVEQEDRSWLSAQMLDGEMDVGDSEADNPLPTAANLMVAIAEKFDPGDNRATRRGKARRVR